MTGSEFPRHEGPFPPENGEPIPPTIYTRTGFELVVEQLTFRLYQHTDLTGFVYVVPDVFALEAGVSKTVGPSEQSKSEITLFLQRGSEIYDLSSAVRRSQLPDAKGTVYAVAASLPPGQESWLKAVWAGNLLDEHTDQDWHEAVVSFLLDKPPFPVGQYSVDTLDISTPDWDVSGQYHRWNGVYMNRQGILRSQLRISLVVEGNGITYHYSLRADDSEQLLKFGENVPIHDEWRGMPRRGRLPVTDQSLAEFTSVLRGILLANSNH